LARPRQRRSRTPRPRFGERSDAPYPVSAARRILDKAGEPFAASGHPRL